MESPTRVSEENKIRKLERQAEALLKQQEKVKPPMKELKIFMKPNTALYSVAFVGGGELPQQLQGSWNNHSLAERAIGLYKAGRQAGTR